jgi:predicted short-subunit dehydrogenase-like oxidoreductase (DUF2520 family)
MIGRAAVYGLGKAGCALIRSLQNAGRVVVATGSRSAERRAAAVKALSVQPASDLKAFARDARGADVVFLAVADGALAEVAAELGPLLEDEPLLAHLAGARGRDVLTGYARSAAFHPLASLSAERPIPEGAACGVDARDHDVGALEALALDLGLVPVRVRDRIAYHLGASLVANLAVALLADGVDLLQAAGLDEGTARVSLARLLGTTATNAEAHPLSEALTGPVPRGDVETVRAHLARLDDDEALRATYRSLSARILRLAKLDDDARRALEEALGL